MQYISVAFQLTDGLGSPPILGVEHGLPTHYPQDMAHFRRTTKDRRGSDLLPVLIVGRKTKEALPPLEERLVITLSRSGLSPKKAEKVIALMGHKFAYVCGGAEIYRLYPQADLILTELADEQAYREAAAKTHVVYSPFPLVDRSSLSCQTPFVLQKYGEVFCYDKNCCRGKT